MKSFRPKKHRSSQNPSANGKWLKTPQFPVSINAAPSKPNTLKLIPLGGVGDVTKNMYVYEYQDDILIVDCGVGFPGDGMPGVDLVIPDISYLRGKKDKIRGIIISHGHEDHLGALPFLWPELQAPIYTQKLTTGFIRSKFAEHNLPKDAVKECNIDTKLKLGVFDVSFYYVSHSVPDTTGIVIRTPVGTIVHQSDFKIDWTPVSSQKPDMDKISKLGQEKVKLLLIDCLRVEKLGSTKTERGIEKTFEKIAEETTGKLLITTTSSNISRLQQAVNVAQKFGRKVALAGRSFETNFQVARDLGYLDVPPTLMIGEDAISSMDSSKVMILIAGSQGQPESALARAVNGQHKFIKIQEGDSVVFSADPIPSSQVAYYSLVNDLCRLGINVYYSDITENLHVSGHAAEEEIKLMINSIKPEFLMPIGGEFRHMSRFGKVSQGMGYDKKNIILAEDGDIYEIGQGIELTGRVDVHNVYVDGLGVGDIGHVVLRDRQLMSEEGIVIVVVPLDHRSGTINGEPDIISRGFVFEDIATHLLEEAKDVVRQSLEKQGRVVDWRFTRKLIEDNLEKFLYQATERRPLILPIVVEV